MRLTTKLLALTLIPFSAYEFCFGTSSGKPDFKTNLALAEQGNANAQLNVGILYDKGWGVAEDDVEAVKWLKKASAQDIAKAHYQLAGMYLKGDGVKKNTQQAKKLYAKAARHGHASSQYNLGIFYASGLDEIDFVRAHQWISLAGRGGNIPTHQHIETLEQHMTPTQISDAKRHAAACYSYNFKGCY